MLKPFWDIFGAISQIVIAVNGQILKIQSINLVTLDLQRMPDNIKVEEDRGKFLCELKDIYLTESLVRTDK